MCAYRNVGYEASAGVAYCAVNHFTRRWPSNSWHGNLRPVTPRSRKFDKIYTSVTINLRHIASQSPLFWCMYLFQLLEPEAMCTRNVVWRPEIYKVVFLFDYLDSNWRDTSGETCGSFFFVLPTGTVLQNLLKFRLFLSKISYTCKLT